MKYEKLRNSCYSGEKFETLKSGKVLLEIERRFLENSNQERILSLIHCLTDSLLLVPMNTIISEADQKILKNLKPGDEISTSDFKDNVRMVPDYLKTQDGKLYIPIFSQEEQADKEYLDHFSKVWLHISEIIELYKHPREKLEGLVLDAHTQPIILNEAFINAIEDIMKIKEEELQKQ